MTTTDPYLPALFYKAVKPDHTYDVGETYYAHASGPAVLCRRGFHACERLVDVFNPSYGYRRSDPVLQVRLGADSFDTDGTKTCSTTMTVVRTVSEAEVAEAVAGPSSGLMRGRRTRGEYWLMDGLLHRGDDLPAIVCDDGRAGWFNRGHLHREGGLPAVIEADGRREWWWMGRRHRPDDLPAVVSPAGHEEWWVDGRLHRGPVCGETDAGLQQPAVRTAEGHAFYWLQGRLHRGGDLPAVVHDGGARAWYRHGQLHREGGQPAYIGHDGHMEWWVENECVRVRVHGHVDVDVDVDVRGLRDVPGSTPSPTRSSRSSHFPSKATKGGTT